MIWRLVKETFFIKKNVLAGCLVFEQIKKPYDLVNLPFSSTYVLVHWCGCEVGVVVRKKEKNLKQVWGIHVDVYTPTIV